MNKIGLYILGIVLGCSLGLNYILWNKQPTVIIKNRLIPGDTVYTEKTITKLKPYKVLVPDIDTITLTVNDSTCIEEYIKLYLEHNTKVSYKDTVQNDTSMTIIVDSYVFRNKLDSFKVSSKNNRPIAITTITNVTSATSKYGAGLMIGYKTITPLVSYSIKNNIDILGGYEVLNKNPQLGIIYKF